MVTTWLIYQAFIRAPITPCPVVWDKIDFLAGLVTFKAYLPNKQGSSDLFPNKLDDNYFKLLQLY